MNLITQNSKLKTTSKKLNLRVFNFGIPAYKTKSGKITCPFADKCIKFCYAQKGAYIWSNVSPAFEKRLQATMKNDFIDVMIKEIKKKKAEYVRVHDSGDYYSKEYLLKWFEIAERMPHIKFYSYTNNVNQIKSIKDVPSNYDFIFSDGGKQKRLIDKIKDRHSKVFKSVKELIKAGYKDAHDYDLYATKWFNNSNKVGLVYH